MRRKQGFTMVELMITVLVLAVVVMFAYPSYLNLMKGMEAKRVRTSLTQANQEAKLHAYLLKRDVYLCLADEMNRCHRQATHKVMLFIDKNNDNKFDSSDELVQEYPLNIKYGTLEMRMSALRSYMKYYGDTGLPRGHFGHFNYCVLDDVVRSHKVIVSSMGYVRVEGGC